MKQHFIFPLLIMLLIFKPSESFSEDTLPTSANEDSIEVTPRHIMILQADLDFIWGSYFFALQNKSSTPQDYSIPIALPKESVDFQPQDGLSEKDIRLDPDGHIVVEKVFPPGLNLMGIGFKIPTTKFGSDFLSISPIFPIGELSVATPNMNDLSVRGDKFTKGLPPMLPADRYRGIQISDVEKNQSLSIYIDGIPKKRSHIQIIGLVIGLLLCGLGVLLTLITAPNQNTQTEEQVI